MQVYLNGEFMPVEEARVPVMDRGFLFGDGIYEVIPVYSRRPFRLPQHLQRLQASLAAIRLPNPHDDAEWTALIEKIVATAAFEDQSVYLQVTRGSAGKRNHAFPQAATPTVLLMTDRLISSPPDQREQGIAVVSAVDNRWLRCDIKATSLLANILLRQQAVDADCVEAVLLRDGILTEGAASNIFVVKDGVLLAPQKNHLVLPGITYDVVLELAATHGLPYQVRDVYEAEVRSADELWMSSSTKEVLPIVSLDHQPVGGGKPGPLFHRMYRWYQDFKATVMRNG